MLPRLDALAKEKGLTTVATAAGTPAAPAPNAGLNGLLTSTDSTRSDSAKGAAAAGKDSSKTETAKKDTASLPGVTGGTISKMILAGNMPGQFMFDRVNADALKNFFSRPDVEAALPPGKVVRFGSDTIAQQGKT